MSQQKILGLMKSAKVLVDFKEKKIDSLQKENLKLKNKLTILDVHGCLTFRTAPGISCACCCFTPTVRSMRTARARLQPTQGGAS